MKVALHGLALKPEFFPHIEILFQELTAHQADIRVTEDFDRLLKMNGNKSLSYWVLENPEDYEQLDFFIFETKKAYPYDGDDFSIPLTYYQFQYILDEDNRVTAITDDETSIYKTYFEYY